MEQKFGCAFNPRPSPGRCIKDPTYKKVDPQCESTNTTCRLFNSPVPSPVPSPSTVLPPLTFTSPLKSTVVSPLDSSQEKISNSPKTDKISGPISAYVTKYHDKKYEFFGDAHFSITGTCSKPCNDIDITNPKFRLSLSEMISSDVPCWDISVLLSNLFNQAAFENKWVDFYLEIPFLKAMPYEEDVKDQVKRAGYLYKLYYIFYNCFSKLKCNYSTTRFHYVDIRQQYKSVDLAQLNEELKQILEARGQQEYNTGTFAAYEIYLVFDRMQKSITNLGEMIMFNKLERNSYIEETDKLIRDLYFSGGQTMTGKIEPKNIRLLKLYLSSNNFDHDVKELMKESIQISKDPIKLLEILVPPTLIVNRRGKNMHRIRAQLEALENEGKSDIANKIVSFIFDTYNSKVNVNKVIDLWRSIMLTYDGFLNNKFKKMENMFTLMDKFMIEYKKAKNLFSLSVSGGSLLMDAYVLSRMFRTYPGKNHVDSSKSIVYAGDAHIQIYVDFFEKILESKFIKYEPNGQFLKKYESGDLTLKEEDIIRCLNVNIQEFF